MQVIPEIEDPILNKLDPPIPVLESTGNVFHDLMSCVVEQQIHYRSTKKLFQKRMEEARLSQLNPSNFDQFEDSLSGIKLSLRKQETIAATLDFFRENQIDWSTLADETVRNTLASIRGVGDWTIDMILLYTLKRPDVFPVGDYHLKKVMSSLYNLDSKKGLKASMLTIADRWRPHRSYAVLKLLAWKEWEKMQMK